VSGLKDVWGGEAIAPGLFILCIRQPWFDRFTFQLLYRRESLPVLFRQAPV